MFKLKQRMKKARNADEPKRTASAALIRITKEIKELSLPDTCTIKFPDPDDLFDFKLTIMPAEGYYKNGTFVFDVKVPSDYPYEPPKVKCETEIFHPNIDQEGNICLNILREDWKPVLSIDAVVYGLQYLLLEPNPHDPLNPAAAEMFKFNKKSFAKNVRKVMKSYEVTALVKTLYQYVHNSNN
ncbi:nedd8-conjugating enzyme UbcE2M [Caerostris darwini]|uniref:Nedd8-conjugating enzyme UbcE2M n=1 Tax=Caerostris darwini TaxID=1538125 RepID=A0AAV4RPQ4_9ARAC|nr:nedd8-conjugating enzyme UbcE2M [Caerostris darwini]